MDNKLPVKRLIICTVIAVIAIGLGIYNILYTLNYDEKSGVFQSLIAAVGITAIGEIFAALSRYPIVSYIISAVLCSVALQIMTPWYIIMPVVDLTYPEMVIEGYRYSVKSCFVVYSIALAVSILFGIFVLHRKDVFKSDK